MRVYRRDYESGAFAGPYDLDDSDRDPITGEFNLPGDVTAIAPPTPPAGEWPFWQDGEWVMRPDPRPAIRTQALRAEAAHRIEACNAVALRCFKRGMPFPDDWRAYDEALAAIVDSQASPAELPLCPPLPNL